MFSIIQLHFLLKLISLIFIKNKIQKVIFHMNCLNKKKDYSNFSNANIAQGFLWVYQKMVCIRKYVRKIVYKWFPLMITVCMHVKEPVLHFFDSRFAGWGKDVDHSRVFSRALTKEIPDGRIPIFLQSSDNPESGFGYMLTMFYVLNRYTSFFWSPFLGYGDEYSAAK